MSETSKRGNKRQLVTIKEVAEKAGVSQMTVSRVLNQKDIVKSATRKRVEAAMASLNYRPNLMARGLAGGKSIFIGFLYHNPSYGYLNEFLVGALNECRELGHHLVVENIVPDNLADARTRLGARLRQIGLDGVIIAPPLSENRDVIDALRDIASPFVRVAHGDLSCADLSVVINDTAAADAMTEYLIKKGHKRIAFILGAKDQSSTALRLAGFKAAMMRNSLAVGGAYVQAGDFTFHSGFDAGEKLLTATARPTAIFASNDEMAAGVIAAAHKHGVRVPEQLSVVGYDDTAIARSVWPQLTTVRQPIAEMARKSVALLAESLDNKNLEATDRLHMLNFSIVERESVAKPARSK
jgi:LacI family transcriptional regulator